MPDGNTVDYGKIPEDRAEDSSAGEIHLPGLLWLCMV